MAYNQQDYSFNNPYHTNGQISRWFSVLKILNTYGPMTKKYILTHLYNAVNYINPKYMGVNGNAIIFRGYLSHMFGCMGDNGAKLITYNKHTREWNITEKGKELVKHYNNYKPIYLMGEPVMSAKTVKTQQSVQDSASIKCIKTAISELYAFLKSNDESHLDNAQHLIDYYYK